MVYKATGSKSKSDDSVVCGQAWATNESQAASAAKGVQTTAYERDKHATLSQCPLCWRSSSSRPKKSNPGLQVKGATRHGPGKSCHGVESTSRFVFGRQFDIIRWKLGHNERQELGDVLDNIWEQPYEQISSLIESSRSWTLSFESNNGWTKIIAHTATDTRGVSNSHRWPSICKRRGKGTCWVTNPAWRQRDQPLSEKGTVGHQYSPWIKAKAQDLSTKIKWIKKSTKAAGGDRY